jgi:hypothetical protein
VIVSERALVIAVRPASALAARRRLFSALEEAFPVRFAACAADVAPAAGLIVLADPAVFADPAATMGLPADAAVPTLVFAASPPRAGVAGDVVLADRAPIDRRLRGVALHEHIGVTVVEPAPVGRGRAVLATGPGGPVWSRDLVPVPVDRVGAQLPDLGHSAALRDALAVPRALALLAIVHFLRALCGNSGWTQPPIRATFVFDDPNLRWPRYGYVDYRRLVGHGDEHGYHTTIAMIPLDAGRVHPDAAATFRARPERLSLVLHGNDHTRRELMRPPDRAAALALGAQALRRVARFEARTGLRVDRVMTPPHGLCSRTVTEALGALGYDALCAIHPAPWTEQTPAERVLAGWNPADFSEGCAVVPRFPLSCSASEIALRAFLGHPLVLYGHHEDLASGLDPLAEAAARVNRLGDVRWMSLGDIVLGNRAVCVDGGTAVVRPWACRVQVTPPRDATSLTVESPPGGIDGCGLHCWSVPELGTDAEALDFGVPLDIDRDWERGGERALTLRVRPHRDADPADVPAPGRRAWPVVRRRVTEARDRMLPARGQRL